MSGPDFDVLGEQLRRDGVVFIERALDSAAMELAAQAYQWSLAHPSRGAARIPQTTPGTFYQDLANPQAYPAYRQLLEQSPAADIAAALWQAPDVWFMYEQVFLKEGGAARRTPWHQDSSYLPIEGDKIAVMWISFEPVPKDAALEFVRGSHRGLLYDGSRFELGDDTAPLYGTGILPRLPDIEATRERWDIVSWAVNPGDVLVFHPRMLHGGGATHGGRRRSTLSLRFFGDDALYTPRVKTDGAATAGDTSYVEQQETSVFARLHHSLVPGDPFRHREFPKLRPR